MTRYCVQVSRFYEVTADDTDEAVEKALERDCRRDVRAQVNVTDLDEVERAGRPIEVAPGMCPYPIRGRLTARECVEAGTCGCSERDAHQPTGDA